MTTVPARPTWPSLVQTKLHPPVVRNDVLPRERLVQMLHATLASCPFTLVSAPAGYGKTTLLATLPLAFPEMPVAWVSLDEEDNDPVRFLAALLAALQQVNPACGVAAMDLLQRTNGGAEASHVLGVLINEIMDVQPGPFVLALDDLHCVSESAVFAALEYLLERVPPQMHVALATREDPPIALSRWRARRQIAEFRVEDLRFTTDEAAHFLNDTLGMALSSEDLALLQDRTEGWPAGVSLLVSAFNRLPRSADRGAFLSHLARLDRYVFDFLAEEVLGTRPPEMRDFLLATSVLTYLTPQTCAAVTGRDDALDCLETLYRSNMFVMEVDEPTATYRYHDLFRDFLRQQLRRQRPQDVKELHRRAALSEDNPWRAMSHFLAAEMWEEAAGAIERIGANMVQRASLDPLREWIEALPVEVRLCHPCLSVLLAVCAWRTWRLDAVRPLLDEALRGFEAAGDEAGRGEVLAMRAVDCGNMALFDEALDAAEKALACPLPLEDRVRILAVRAWQALAGDHWEQALSDLDGAMDLVEESSDLIAMEALAVQFHALFIVLPGGVERAERFRRILLAHIGEEDHPLQATVAGLTAWIELWRGRWEITVDAVAKDMAISERYGGLWWLTVDVEALTGMVSALRGDEETAEKGFAAFYGALSVPAAAPFAGPWLSTFLFFLGRVRWLQGRIPEAREVYQRMLAAEAPREWPSGPLMRDIMRGILEMADGRTELAEQTLRDASRRQESLHFSYVFGDAHVLLAHLYRETGRPRDALRQYLPVVGEHEKRNTPGRLMWAGPPIAIPLLRLVVEHGEHSEFASRVLALMGEKVEAPGVSTIRVPRTGETLSAREVEVLRLIASGANNPAIAEELVISIHTVKRHVANLLSKLDVASRTEAAVLARDLGVA